MPLPLPETLYTPDTLKNWPWPRTINPHLDQISQESKEWFLKFNALSEKSQQNLCRGDFGKILIYIKELKIIDDV
jgi:hypothetical protein